MHTWPQLHSWDVPPEEARAIQQRLRGMVIGDDQPGEIQTVAGVDVGFEEEGAVTRAAVAVLRLHNLEPVTSRVAHRPTSFPYVPGLLSFREMPAVLDALAQIDPLPDLLLCDGAGYAHPRRFGLACHLGVLTGIPSIGVAKSWLIGTHGDIPDQRGAWVPLVDKDEVIGAALRTRPNTRPIFVSIGHRISLATAIDYVLRCTRGYRLPETTRAAHSLASRTRR